MKLVIRLLDASGNLLGWVEHRALLRGDGMLRASGPVVIPIEAEGQPAQVSVHWCEVNVETRSSVDGAVPPVKIGDSLSVYGLNTVLIAVGPQANGLPPVTVRRRLEVAVPTGGLGAST